MARISACVMTYNEEHDIEVCLQSLRWANEIIVLDSFSKDRTLEIAKKYTDKIFQSKWPGSPSIQRNLCAQKAAGDWILQVDADERIPKELSDEIMYAINSQAHFDAYYIARKNYWLGYWIRHGGWYPDYGIRLYKKASGSWEGHSHEKFTMKGEAGILKNPLIHDNLKSIHEHVQKQIFSSLHEIREVAENNLKIYWIFPFRVTGFFIWRFIRGPKNWIAVRALYKELITNKVEIAWLIPMYPLIRFFYMYILRFGFLDGIPGFWVAVLSSTNEALRYAKIWEYLHNKNKKTVNLDYFDSEKMQDLYRSSWVE
jgi:glycosyltransferase involved in cell wall biosynthesis